jgi:hypothetical protein
LATVIDGPRQKAQTIGVSLEISLAVMEIPAPGLRQKHHVSMSSLRPADGRALRVRDRPAGLR